MFVVEVVKVGAVEGRLSVSDKDKVMVLLHC